MPNAITTQATEIINNQDDKLENGMGLGSSSPQAEVIEIDDGYDPDDYKPTVDPEFAEYDPIAEAEYWQKQEEQKQQEEETSTNWEQKEYEISQEIEKLEELFENINNMKNKDLLNLLTEKELKDLTGYNKTQLQNILVNKNSKRAIELKEKLINSLKENTSNQLQALRTERDSYYDKWDRRTDEQKRQDQLREEQHEREDTAYQRTKEDLIKAGYNPAMISGVNYGGGGGGGGSSKADEEEEKRRKRKREREAREAAERQARQQALRSVLSTLGITAGYIGGSAIRSAGYIKAAKMRNQKPKNQKPKKNQPDWLDDYIKNF